MLRPIITALFAAGLAATSAQAATVSIGTSAQGSNGYASGAAIAKIATETTELKVGVVPEGGAGAVLPMVQNGELEFTLAPSVTTNFAVAGQDMFEKSGALPDLKAVAVLFPLNVGFFVRKDSDIKTIADLKGKRLGTEFPKQPFVPVTGAAKLATAGLTYTDIDGVPEPDGVHQVDDFLSGKLDAVTFSLSSGKTAEANAKVGIRVLSLPKSDEAQKAMQKVAPGSVIATLEPGPRWPGVDGPTNVMQFAVLLVTSTKTPDDVVYKITKSLYENQAKLAEAHGVFKDFDPKTMNADFGLPYHAGAEKFFKEAGIN